MPRFYDIPEDRKRLFKLDSELEAQGVLAIDPPITAVLRHLTERFGSKDWFGDEKVEAKGKEINGFNGGIRVYNQVHKAHFIKREGDTGTVFEDFGELTIPCIIMEPPDLVPPLDGLNLRLDEQYVELGVYPTGVKRIIRFPVFSVKDLQIGVVLLRESPLDIHLDQELFEHFIKVNENMDVFGNNLRTKMVLPMNPNNIENYSDISAARGVIQVHRVPMFDPRFIEETARIESVTLEVGCKVEEPVPVVSQIPDDAITIKE